MTSIAIATARHIRQRGRHRKPPVTAKVIGRLTTVALLAILLLMLAIAYGTVDNRWYRVLSIQGNSMAPTIETGDLTFISRPDHIEVGDIAVFQLNGSIVTHRVVAIEDDGSYVTQGDANPSPDRWDPESVEVVGVYLFRIPLLGNLFGSGVGAFLTDRAGVTVDLAAELNE
jgi:signal peptidase